MLITIRQGIVRAQSTPTFITFSSGQANFNADTDPTVIAFADGSTDYLLTESETIKGAWTGPFVGGTDYWLYWDINKDTGIRTFGSTTVEPTFGKTLPISPKNSQHFFDTTVNKMLVWNGDTWVERLRVFAAKLIGGKTLNPEGVGSQIKLNQTRNAGHILFDQTGNPLKLNDGSFFTSETLVSESNNKSNFYKLNSKQSKIRAVENIPKFHMLTFKGPNQIGVASSNDQNYRPAIGLAGEDIVKNEMRNYITDGYVTNEEWNFTETPGTLLYVGPNGEVTTTVPRRISMQRIGHVADANRIYLRIEELYKISAPVVTVTPTPTPTKTQTVTPTVTPTNTITPTVTPTNTITPTPTPTNTITPTVTVTPQLTPTVTVTPTVTLTATITPVSTSTPTPTPSATPPTVFTSFTKWV